MAETFRSATSSVRRKVIRTRREKLVWRSDEANALYDLGRDPQERRNLRRRRSRSAPIDCAAACSTGWRTASGGPSRTGCRGRQRRPSARSSGRVRPTESRARSSHLVARIRISFGGVPRRRDPRCEIRDTTRRDARYDPWLLGILALSAVAERLASHLGAAERQQLVGGRRDRTGHRAGHRAPRAWHVELGLVLLQVPARLAVPDGDRLARRTWPGSMLTGGWRTPSGSYPYGFRRSRARPVRAGDARRGW